MASATSGLRAFRRRCPEDARRVLSAVQDLQRSIAPFMGGGGR